MKSVPVRSLISQLKRFRGERRRERRLSVFAQLETGLVPLRTSGPAQWRASNAESTQDAVFRALRKVPASTCSASSDGARQRASNRCSASDSPSFRATGSSPLRARSHILFTRRSACSRAMASPVSVLMASSAIA
jgi:hypothetical protein